MRRLALLAMITVFSFSAQAQYFGLESSEWKYVYYNLGYASTNVISVSSDTLLDGFSAQVYSNYRTTFIPQQVGYYSYSQTIPYGIIRFNDDSVFYWKNEQFNLLYDFGAQVGDSWAIDENPVPCLDSIAMVEVVGTGSVDVNGISRRYIDLETTADTWVGLTGRCIEGIGLTSDLFLSQNNFSGAGFLHGGRFCDTILVPENLPNIFVCYSDSVVGTYDPFDTFCIYGDFEVGYIEHAAFTDRVLAYPNPTTGQFTIQLPLMSELTTIEVFDTHGRVVHSQNIGGSHSNGSVGYANGVEQHNLVVDLSLHSNGPYLVQVIAGNEVFRSIVIKR